MWLFHAHILVRFHHQAKTAELSTFVKSAASTSLLDTEFAVSLLCKYALGNECCSFLFHHD